MRTRTWNNVPGTLTVECYLYDVIRNASTEQPLALPPEAAQFVPRVEASTGCEVVIEFVSSGSHTPMSMYGGRDHLGWPEDHDEEREPKRAYMLIDGRKQVLSLASQRELFAMFADQIDEAELDTEACRDE